MLCSTIIAVIQGKVQDNLLATDARCIALFNDCMGKLAADFLLPELATWDELVFEIPADKRDEAVTFIKTCMEVQPFPEFDVPIIAEAAYGANFGELKEMG